MHVRHPGNNQYRQDGVGLNHLPSGRFAANGAWLAVCVMAHDLARWTARLGLGAEELRASRPELITVDISGYGKGGPYAQARAYDLLVQSEAGSCAITGTVGQPVKPGIPLADIGAGMYALSSVLAALFVRERTGVGTAISVGMFDVVAEWMGPALHLARYGGRDLVPTGLSSRMVARYGSYQTADGQTLVLGTTNDREWQRLATQVLDRPDLAADPRYARNSDRVARRAELDAVIGEWAAGLGAADCRAAGRAAVVKGQRFHRKLNRHGQAVDRKEHAREHHHRREDQSEVVAEEVVPGRERVDGQTERREREADEQRDAAAKRDARQQQDGERPDQIEMLFDRERPCVQDHGRVKPVGVRVVGQIEPGERGITDVRCDAVPWPEPGGEREIGGQRLGRLE